MRPMRQELPRGLTVRGIRAFHVLPSVSPVEMVGSTASYAEHLQDVSGTWQRRFRRSLRLSSQ